MHIGLVPLEQQKRHVQDIMRRIPAGSEVSTVLVGQVEYMQRPALAFVRLSQGRFLENLTEVPLPVRFVFVLLGPENSGMDYHEVGRSISTLMSNQVPWRFFVFLCRWQSVSEVTLCGLTGL